MARSRWGTRRKLGAERSTAACALVHCCNPSLLVHRMPLSGSVKLLCAFASGTPKARLYGRTPGIAILSRLPAPLPVPHPLLRFQSCLRRLDRRQTRLARLAPLQLLGKFLSAHRLPETRIFFRVNLAGPRQ